MLIIAFVVTQVIVVHLHGPSSAASSSGGGTHMRAPETGHRVYDGDTGPAICGGSGSSGLEQNADCVTQRWGISTSNYTSSCGGARGSAAAAIAAGHKS